MGPYQHRMGGKKSISSYLFCSQPPKGIRYRILRKNMNRNFWKRIAHHADHGPKIALVSIIGHKGSTPQGTGNKMLFIWTEALLEQLRWSPIRSLSSPKVITNNANIRTELNLTTTGNVCGIVEVFIEIIHPTDQLIIYGAGHVEMALAN